MVSLFFSRVTLYDPVIAALDGENGNEYQRQLLPSYKAHRRFSKQHQESPRGENGGVSLSEFQATGVLYKYNVMVIMVNRFEAGDVVATLTNEVLQRGYLVVIGSPDKDFKQLISDDVQILMPLMLNLGFWSFYMLRHYTEQYKCEPSSDLSLRCMIGEVAGVPALGIVRRTTLKLLKKYGSLKNLLTAAVVRTMCKHYAQDALTKHTGYLLRNLQVLSKGEMNATVSIEILDEKLSKFNNSQQSFKSLSHWCINHRKKA